MSPEGDLENNFDQGGIELNNVPANSSGEERRPKTALNNAYNSTQQSGGMDYGGDRSPTANERARPLRLALAPPAGHPRLAELMSRRPQMLIYRRFSYLNSQNLLYMQAELMGLEKELKELQIQDATSGGQMCSRAQDWKVLSQATPISTGEAGGQSNETSTSQGASCCVHRRCEEWCCGERELHGHCPQWNLALKIREKLQRYSKFMTGHFYLSSPHMERKEANHVLALYRSLIFPCQPDEALIQQMNLASAGAPDFDDTDLIQSFLVSEHFEMKGALLGDDQFAWGSKEDPDAGEQLHDLVALAPPPKRDPLNDWVFKRVMKRKFVLRPFWCGLLKVTESSLLRWTTAATVSVTASVPIASSVVLYVTPGTNLRLALLAVINGLATLFLFIFTDAQPIQIVTLLAAWNAVNIVFVSSNATDST